MNNTNIVCTDQPDAVSITITGAAFENLKQITAIFNAWNESAFTPAELIDEHLIAGEQLLQNLSAPNPGEYKSTLPGALVDIYNAEPDADALRVAFENAGFAVQS